MLPTVEKDEPPLPLRTIVTPPAMTTLGSSALTTSVLLYQPCDCAALPRKLLPVCRLSKTSVDPLPADAVVTIEPGVYLPGDGGVRIEDDVHLCADGPVLLSDGRTELLELV